MIRNSLKNILSKILFKKKLLESFDIIEGIDGVDILYKMVHDEEDNLIRCIITSDTMQYMKGCEALRILKQFKFKRQKRVPVALLKVNEENKNFIQDFEEYVGKYGLADIILQKPCPEKSILKFLEDYKIFEEV